MNIFRLAGDMSHLLAILLLIAKIWKSKSVVGLSGKSQVKKIDWNWIKQLSDFIHCRLPDSLSWSLLELCLRLQYRHENRLHYLLRRHVLLHLSQIQGHSQSRWWSVSFLKGISENLISDNVSFRMIFIIVPAAGLAALVHHDSSFQELCWTFSVYLEAVAIMPQLQMIAETGEAETITSHYLLMMGLYRWVWGCAKNTVILSIFQRFLPGQLDVPLS